MAKCIPFIDVQSFANDPKEMRASAIDLWRQWHLRTGAKGKPAYMARVVNL